MLQFDMKNKIYLVLTVLSSVNVSKHNEPTQSQSKY